MRFDKDALEKALNETFQQIRAHIAKTMGYGDLDSLSPEQAAEVSQMAEDATESWDEAEIDTTEGVPVTNEFQALLEKYYNLGEDLGIAQDQEIGESDDDEDEG